MSHLGVYQVVKQLGEGGMATAWLAVAPTGNYVVLKVPLLTDPSMAVRLRDEAQAGRRIHHPHVVSTLDFFVDAGRPVLVIEFVDGCALRNLRTRDNFRNPLPAAGVAFLGRTISEALCAIHEAKDDAGQPLAMLHRDVTASNILLGRDGNPKLIDLGIARSAENEGEKTQAGMLKGTLRYLAPELLMGEGYTASTDLWSLGVCLFEAALGRQMVAGEPVDIFRALTSGSYRALRRGERIEPALQDALFALLTEKATRLRNARAAARMFAGLEARFGPGQHIISTLVPYAQESSDDDPSAFSSSDPGAVAAEGFDDAASTMDTVLRKPRSATEPPRAPPPPPPPPKVVIGGTEYGTAATLQMQAVPLAPPGPTIVLPAVNVEPPAATTTTAPAAAVANSRSVVLGNVAPGPTLVLPAVDIPVPPSPGFSAASSAPAPTIVLPAVDVRPPPAAPGPTMVLPAMPRLRSTGNLPLVDVRPAGPSASPARPAPSAVAGPTLVMPSVNPVNAMAGRVAAAGDVLPEGASTLQMAAWTPPEPAKEEQWEDVTDPEPPPPPPPPPPPRFTKPQAPASEQAKQTLLLPVAAALKVARDDDD